MQRDNGRLWQTAHAVAPLQVAATSSNSTGSIDIDDVAGRKLSIWDLLRFTLPTLGVWVINPILRYDMSHLTSP